MDIVNDEEIIQLNHGGKALTFEDIKATIEAVADKYQIDLLTCKQGQYKAVLGESGRILFQPKGCLKDPKNINNQYDYSLIEKIGNVFLMLCRIYGGKFPTPYAFSVFTGIDYDSFLSWQNGRNSNVASGASIKKILNARNEAITDKLFDSNNVTGQAMLANNILGWNTSRSQSQSISVNVDNIPTLSSELSNILIDSNI